MRNSLFGGLFLLSLVFCIAAESAPRTLVLLDHLQTRSTHSLFFQSLQARGHQLSFHHANDNSVRLSQHGQYFYDNLILMAPSAEDFSEHVNVESIGAFIDSGRNVLLAVDTSLTETMRDIATDVGVEFHDDKTSVVDHFHYDSLADDGSHTRVLSSQVVEWPVVVGERSQEAAPVLFKGIGHSASEPYRLLIKVLAAEKTAYSGSSSSSSTSNQPESLGQSTLLVSAHQMRNNARVVVCGSLAILSDEMWNADIKDAATGKSYARSSNEHLFTHLSAWNFQERGQLRATQVQHHLTTPRDSEQLEMNPAAYRVTDNVTYSVLLEEFDGVSGSWQPLVVDGEHDVLLELVMMDPYIRTPLKHDGKGRFSTSLMLPDVFGVYKFKLVINKNGYTNLESETQVSVRPFRHDEYERFIDVAYPYYSSVLSLFIAFTLFGVLFLYSS